MDANQRTKKSVARFKPEEVVVHAKRQHPEALGGFCKLRSVHAKQFEFALVDVGNVDDYAGLREVVQQVVQISRRLVWWIRSFDFLNVQWTAAFRMRRPVAAWSGWRSFQ